MLKWISGQELINNNGLKDFELFNLLKMGLQPYESITGRKIIDSDPLERAPDQTYEEIEANQRAKADLHVFSSSHGPPPSETTIKLSAQRLYEGQRKKIINPHKDCIPKSFSLSENSFKAIKQIAEAKQWLFKRDDILEIGKRSRLDLNINKNEESRQSKENLDFSRDFPTEDEKPLSEKVDDFEGFIRGLKVSYESDEEINIKEPKKSAKSWRNDQLCFSTRGKYWQTLIDLLKQGDDGFIIRQTKSVQGKTISVKGDHIKEINKRLIQFFEKQFNFTAPKGFKIYNKDKGTGVCKFTFNVINAQTDGAVIYESMNKDELLKEAQRLSLRCLEAEKRGNSEQKMECLGEIEIIKMIAPSKGITSYELAQQCNLGELIEKREQYDELINRDFVTQNDLTIRNKT